MSNSQESLTTVYFNILWWFLHMSLAIALRGWVVLSYWDWFIHPMGAPNIVFWHALGISTLVSFLTNQENWSAIKLKSAQQKEYGIEDGLSACFADSAWAIFSCLSFMGIGWLYATMM